MCIRDSGSIVDDTNSIKFIKFANSPEEGDALLKQLKGLQRVRVQGSVNFDDRFDKDYILSIRSIEACLLYTSINLQDGLYILPYDNQ